MATKTNEKATKKQTSRVAQYIDNQLQFSDKKLREIADEVGFATTNLISMIRVGTTKMPVAKVKKMAVALGVDPLYLLRLVMSEYDPESWSVIEEVANLEAVPTGAVRDIASIAMHSPLAGKAALTEAQILKVQEFFNTL